MSIPLGGTVVIGRSHDGSDVRMPLYGVGTWTVQEESVLYDTIDASFRVGIRFIDTAILYDNHKQIANVLAQLMPKYKLTRADLFITSKLPPDMQGRGNARAAVEQALVDLNIDYIDLMLIHFPGLEDTRDSTSKMSDAEARNGSWEDLQDMYDAGKLRSIGVSNYEAVHLDSLLSVTRVHPSVNQCEVHPFYPNRHVFDYCRRHNIHMQAYSSLGGHRGVGTLITNATVVRIADAHSCTPAQVLYAYALCQGMSVLPRTTNAARVAENVRALNVHLTDMELRELTALGESGDEKKYSWDPRDVM